MKKNNLINQSIAKAKSAAFPMYQDAIKCNYNNTYHKVIKNFVQEETSKFALGQKESKLSPY